MKKIYLCTLAFCFSAGLFAQLSIDNAGFEGRIQPHPNYSASYPSFCQVEGWGSYGFNGHPEAANPGMGSQSLILNTSHDPATAGAFTGSLGMTSAQGLVPGLVSQEMVLNGFNAFEDLEISFLYQSNITGSGRCGVNINVIADGNVQVYSGTFEITAPVTEWTVGQITLTPTGSTATPAVMYINVTTDLDAYLNNDGSKMVEGTFLKMDDFRANVLGVEEKAEVTLTVYPNPASNVINVTCNRPMASITLFDIDGKKVASSATASINIETLAPGTYVCEIATKRGEIMRQNFIKQ